MTDQGQNRTRRGFLALAGAAGSAALAGCSAIRGELLGDGDESPKIDGSKLAAMAEKPAPSVPPVVPVDVERSYLDGQRKRVRDLLATAPDPLGPDEIPNGAIREEITNEREEAEGLLREARSAASPLDALDHLRSARQSAGYVAAAWQAIDEGLTHEEAIAGRDALREDVESFRRKWEYAGTDPVRALLVHRLIEYRLASATRYVEDEDRFGRFDGQPNIAPAVGQAAGRLEMARASLDHAAAIDDRFRASLADSTDLTERFVSVAESMLEEQRRKRDDLPEIDSDDPSELVDRDVEGTPAAEALGEFYRDLTHWKVPREWKRDEVATVIVEAHERTARFRAFESLRDRVADGEDFAVDGASDVTGFREDAVAAIETAAATDGYPRLARWFLGDLARWVDYADDRFSDMEGDVRAEYVSYQTGEYVRFGETARAVPEASERVGDALRDA